MVQTEYLSDKFVRHYSDSNLMIQKEGTDEIYSDAVDLLPCEFVYIETDIPIENNEEVE